ncbi:MAG: rhodanese-like protein [Sediminibacterium sp.]|nr:rhodanese-like protein [Sediminibacterium sp.]
MIAITPKELHQQMAQQPFLLDVREPFEHEAFHIGGILIPLGQIVSQLDAIPKDRPVIVYCKRGIRSQIAIQRLEKFGFTNLINLQGGMEAWQSAGLNPLP